MAKIDDIQLTSEVNSHLVEILDGVPDKLLSPIGREHLPGGFTKPKAIRRQMANIINGDGVLPSWLRKPLSQHVKWGQTVEALSPKTIREIMGLLAALHGKELMVGCLLLDERPEVQKAGAELMALQMPEPTEEGKLAAKADFCTFLNATFMPVIDMTLEISGDENPDKDQDDIDRLPPTFDETHVNELKAKIQDAKDQCQRLRKKSDEARRKNTDEIKTLGKKLKDQDGEFTRADVEWTARLRKLEKENAELSAEIDDTRKTIDKRVKEGVERETSVAARKWLGEARALSDFLEQREAGGDGILSRVESVLKAQARQDKHSGTRTELNARLHQFRKARQQLLDASENAIHPVPDLSKMVSELQTEITQIEKRLDLTGAPDPLAGKVLININESDTWDGLSQCGESIEKLGELDLLDAESQKRLYHCLHRKYSVLAEKSKPSGEAVATDSGWTLRGVLHRNQSSQLILDGHNIMHLLRDVFTNLYEDDSPGGKAREALIEMTRKLVAQRPHVKATLYFDSPNQESINVLPNFSYVFSGGTGDNRADNAIVDRLNKRSLSELDQTVFVVTDDRGLRARILDKGATHVPVGIFGVFLEDFGCLS
jgi:predicted  nucleic acid-binding Zn-ribbon protein